MATIAPPAAHAPGSTQPTTPPTADPAPRLWTADEFRKMQQMRLFADRDVFVSGGTVLERHPDGPRPFRFTRPELYALNNAGFFWTNRVELIRGVIWEARTVSNPPHRTAVRKTTKALERAFPTGVDVRPEGELDLGLDIEPQPDVAVVPGSIEDYAVNHPKTALLLVEVSDTTLFRDLTEKAELYAEAGISEYWVIDLPHRKLHVLHDPGPHPVNGHFYRCQRESGPDETVSPLAAPQATIPVSELLP